MALHDRPDLIGGLDKGIHDGGIEVCSPSFFDDRHCLFKGEAVLVAALGNQRIEYVRHRHDPGGKGDIRSGEMIRITAPVPFLMVVVRQVPGFEQIPGVIFGNHIDGAGNDLGTGGCVGLAC